MLVLKINERAKNNNPLSTLHKLFKDGSESTQTVSRDKIRSLFTRFDILTSEKDFEAFFKSHDRGDGTYIHILVSEYDIYVLTPIHIHALICRVSRHQKIFVASSPTARSCK